MAFMEPEIVHGEWYEVETSNGVWWLPTEVCLEKDLKDYVDGEIQEVTVREQCWGARLSASGYLDCTDWCAGFETEEEAQKYLAEMYGEDEEEEAPCCGLCGEVVEGRDQFSPDGQTFLCQACTDTTMAAALLKVFSAPK